MNSVAVQRHAARELKECCWWIDSHFFYALNMELTVNVWQGSSVVNKDYPAMGREQIQRGEKRLITVECFHVQIKKNWSTKYRKQTTGTGFAYIVPIAK